MKKFSCIINVNLEYIIEATNEKEAREKLYDTELPKEYCTDTFQLNKIEEVKE